MIGYVLLIAGIIALSAIVYVWLKSYVPREAIECPEGVSIFIKESTCKEIDGIYNLNFSLRNNGRFGVEGYFIKGSFDPEQQDIATKDISRNITVKGDAPEGAGIVLFPGGVLSPTQDLNGIEFEFGAVPISLIEITPVTFETIEGKNKLIACGNARVKEVIICEEKQEPQK